MYLKIWKNLTNRKGNIMKRILKTIVVAAAALLPLAAAAQMAGLKDVLMFCVGSDGTDGPTDAAGGIVTGEFARECQARGLSIDAALANNDAYPLLKAMDALIMTGPTGTNVNDVSILLMR